MSDLVILHDTPDSKYGSRPEDRSLAERIRLGVAIVDKPTGPTSHQVSAWVRDMFGVPKAGHSGTLDPRVTGVLPVALADATRAVEAVLAGDKEYVGVLQLHQDVDARRVRAMMARFVGEIYQIPPVRSAVKREQRARMVSEFEPLEIDGRDVLFRVRCESGTYIRTLAVDVGDALGVGANLVDLRRTRTATFTEADAHPLNAFRDALVTALATDVAEWLVSSGVPFRSAHERRILLSPAATLRVRCRPGGRRAHDSGHVQRHDPGRARGRLAVDLPAR